MQKPLKEHACRYRQDRHQAEGVMARGLALEYAGTEFNGEAALRLPVSSRPSAFGPEPAHLWTSMIMP